MGLVVGGGDAMMVVVCVLCMVRVGRVAHWVKGDLVGGLVAFCGWVGVWVLASKGGGCEGWPGGLYWVTVRACSGGTS